MTLHDWIEIVKGVSVLLASLFAIYGIDAWRREFVGKRRMELAEEVLALFYQARDVIAEMRMPFSFVGEGTSRKPGPHESPDTKCAQDSAYVLIERYGRHSELFSRIHALRYRFMAQFDTASSKPFDELNRIINELMMSAQELAELGSIPEWLLKSDVAIDKHQQERKKILPLLP